MKWSTQELLQATQARNLSSKDVTFEGVATDSRKNLEGQLFVALKGARTDGHQYLQQAVRQGAAGLLVHEMNSETESLAKNVPVFIVSDTLLALQAMARFYRRKCNFKVVGITGSNGKTTTKEFTKTLLDKSFRVYASEGSFNNHWGVPLTLLNAPVDTQVVVQEMGMNHSGELTELAQICEPDIVVVTMVGRAHIGELGSQEAVAKAKQEIYKASPQAIGIFNMDNEHTIQMFEDEVRAGRKTMFTFSSYRPNVNVSLRAHRVWLNRIAIAGTIGKTESESEVPVMGRQNVVNIMAAASVALALGVPELDIWKRLSELKTIWGRGQIFEHKSGAQIVFDGYNANPESAILLIKNMMEIEVPGHKIAVLGDMLELGSFARKAHQELGEACGASGFHTFWFIGQHGIDFEKGLQNAKFGGEYFSSPQFDSGLAAYLHHRLQSGDVAVIKGSRGMKLERVLESWEIKGL